MLLCGGRLSEFPLGGEGGLLEWGRISKCLKSSVRGQPLSCGSVERLQKRLREGEGGQDGLGGKTGRLSLQLAQ